MWEYGPGPRATGAIWSHRTVAVSGQEVGWSVYGVRCAGVAEPLRLVDFGYVQTVLPELDPGSRATGAIWSRRTVAGPGPEFGFGRPAAYAVRVAEPSPSGCLSECSDQAPGMQVPKPASNYLLDVSGNTNC